MTGSEVTKLQKFLVAKSHLKLAATDTYGSYGNKTFLAVRDFQCKNSIVCTGSAWGSVGPKTMTAINTMIAKMSPVTGTAPVATTGLGTVDQFLWLGLENNDVRKMQQILIKQGYLTVGPSDTLGYFGAKTAKALRDFQCQNNIICSGEGWGTAGSKTLKALNALVGGTSSSPAVPVYTAPVVKTPVTTPAPVVAPSTSGKTIGQFLWIGLRNDDVATMQQILIKESLLTMTPSDTLGLFDSKTQKAVKDFQCKYDIVCGGDGWGVVGSKTLKALNSR
jgi:peptidoglycan hydrolase-like protein with peptidoglycan-binding domain